MANQLILGRALDANGYIAGAATATVYADGTTTLITVYSDVDGATPAANPITADANGQWPQRYVTEDAKVVVKDSDGVTLYTLDPAPVSQGTGAAASAVSFSPTVDLPQTNVQDAIEAAGALAISGVSDFGIGVTGNAVLLANVDATNIPAGVYRFDGTTTGTYPAGVAAADTGLVEHWRQTSATAMQFLFHATSNRFFHRRMASSVWGTWREGVTASATDPNADRILFWDDSAGAYAFLTAGTGLAITGTTLDATGVDLFFRLNSASAGTNGTGAQGILPQSVTLEASSVYEYELFCSLSRTAGSTGHTFSTLFGGTATLNNIYREFIANGVNSSATTGAAPNIFGYSLSAAAVVMIGGLSGSTTNVWLREKGTVSINGAGTFIPQYQLSAAPGGAYSTNAGSFFRLRKLGASGSDNTQGTWA